MIGPIDTGTSEVVAGVFDGLYYPGIVSAIGVAVAGNSIAQAILYVRFGAGGLFRERVCAKPG